MACKPGADAESRHAQPGSLREAAPAAARDEAGVRRAQNLGEAEMVVSVYMYMRLRGYPAAQISILSPYNGQVALLRDVVERRCAQHPAFGRPHKVHARALAEALPGRLLNRLAGSGVTRAGARAQVATVDKYQGQQNEYVLLSLTRTRAVGHIRDVRRLVVAMSRARLGLYVFGRAALFANCYELQPTFTQLLARPTQLLLHPSETVAVRQRAWCDVMRAGSWFARELVACGRHVTGMGASRLLRMAACCAAVVTAQQHVVTCAVMLAAYCLNEQVLHNLRCCVGRPASGRWATSGGRSQ